MSILETALIALLAASLLGNAIQFGMGKTAKRKYDELTGENK